MSTTCPAYSIPGEMTATCGPVSVCPGTSITISGCGACTGYQQLGISNSTGALQSGYNYNGCGSTSTCAKFTYGVSSNASACEDYEIQEFCYGSQACTGTVSYSTFANPEPYVNVYSVYDTKGCGGTPTVSEYFPVGACVSIYSGVYMQVTCDGSSSSSSWTAVSYPHDNCFGSFIEKLHGTNSASCEAFTNTRMRDYKVAVNCAADAPPDPNPVNPNGSGGDSSSSDTVIIAGAATGGAVFVALVVVGVLYLKGMLCFAKAPLASAAEPAV